jgi:6-pyruvoyltetrahydropterin/6-carboxytetrahydropterin synthase
MIVKRVFHFEAAHRLPHHPGKCRALHGHSYRLVVSVDRPVEAASGMAIDFGDVKAIVSREIIERVDHRSLNDVIDNPTAELIAVWIWERLTAQLAGLTEVELWETKDCAAVYRGA